MGTPLLTGPALAEVHAVITGDIGGAGISRFRFVRNDSTSITVADCNAAGAAVRAFWATIANMPSTVTVQVQAAVELFDPNTALVQGFLNMTTVPAPVVGGTSGAYAAGIGARVNWKTSTLSGRRLIRGSTYVVPLGSGIYTPTGGLGATQVTLCTNAANNYLAAMTTAQLSAVVWHRPPKGLTSGGLVGLITGAVVPSTPAGLRSRRS